MKNIEKMDQSQIQVMALSFDSATIEVKTIFISHVRKL
jgi:hypothetical protein